MNTLIAQAKKWRTPISQIFTLLVLGLMAFWVSQNYAQILQVLGSIGFFQGMVLLLVLTMAYLASVAAFVILIRSFGYSYPFWEGYHALNLAQIASLIPGGVWSLISLGSLLWGAGVSKKDSALILAANMAFGLCACILFGAFAVAATFGWQYAFVCLIPVLGWVVARPLLERLRQRIWTNSSPLPPVQVGLLVLAFSLLAWSIESATFVWLFRYTYGDIISPFFAASAYAAAYFVGFIVPLTPAGLGIREGVLVGLLGGSLSVEAVLAFAVSFRLLQLLAQWLNILVTLIVRLHRQIAPVR